MRYLLTVSVPSAAVFRAYWYGTGELISETVMRIGEVDRWTYTVDYGCDEYRAQYQCDRFASGLYFGTVTVVAS